VEHSVSRHPDSRLHKYGRILCIAVRGVWNTSSHVILTADYINMTDYINTVFVYTWALHDIELIRKKSRAN
jgi:hypothetical protein